MTDEYVVNLRFPKSWKPEIEAAAKADRRSMHNLLVGIVRDGLDALAASPAVVEERPAARRSMPTKREVTPRLKGMK